MSRMRGAGRQAVLPRSLLLVPILSLFALASPGDASGQKLEEYDYENLGLKAIGADILWVNAKDAKGAIGFGFRADLGFLGPYVRVVPRFAHWNSDIEDSSVARFESNLEALCSPPGCAIELGELKRDYWVVGLDLQWTLPSVMVAPYLGAGAELYILNDSGPAIRGTFLDDAVVTAGLSAVAGVQADMANHLRLRADVRGTLVTSASNVAIYAGIDYVF